MAERELAIGEASKRSGRLERRATKGAIMPDLSVFKNGESQAAADAYVEEIKASSACSYWLKAALEEALKRDPVDAANDAEALSMILQVRAAANLHEMTRKA